LRLHHQRDNDDSGLRQTSNLASRHVSEPPISRRRPLLRIIRAEEAIREAERHSSDVVRRYPL